MANAIAYRENCQSGDDLASGIGEGMHREISGAEDSWRIC